MYDLVLELYNRQHQHMSDVVKFCDTDMEELD